MTESTAVHAHKIIAGFGELFGEECISSTVIAISIVEEYYALAIFEEARISEVSDFQFFALALDFQLDGIDFWELDSFVVDVFPLKDPLFFSYLLANEGPVLEGLLLDCAAPLHGLDDYLALLLVGVVPFDLFESLVVVSGALAVRV